MMGGSAVDTQHLVTFRHVAALGSFTRAAERLGFSQSTVSSQIAALEENLGVSLFDRTGRRVLLTEEGRRLETYAEEFRVLEERMRDLGRDGADLRGELRIAAGESVTVYRLGGVLAACRERFPALNLSLRNSQCPTMIEWVRQGEVDVAVLISQPIGHPDLAVEILAEEPMLFVGSGREDPARMVRALEEHRLEACLIHTEQGCSYRLFVENFLRERGVVPERTMEFWSMEAIKRCVENGLGISFLPRMVVREELASGRMRALPCPGLKERFVTQLVVRRREWISPGARAFGALCREHAAGWETRDSGKG